MEPITLINSTNAYKRSRLTIIVVIGLMLTMLLQFVPAAPADAAEKPGWSIRVELPKNRWKPGTLSLYDKNGSVIFRTKCLGRSEFNTPMHVTFGNTPTGVYQGHLGRVRSNTHSYGPYRTVDLVGVSGIGKTSRRTGILIHAGDPGKGGSLRPSRGCVRLSNLDQKRLGDRITALVNGGYKPAGTVIITER